ncbi:Fe-S cluster assembly protein HesB [Serinibacter arcticus]|uniref:Fe-S cluster assembly protein HesB n=1 Tax=Serinibacter arcticus TaxID=1655435 RepID=A0A2U1ZUU3_9MICO|nr:Fe-S cluster assembly protein HesB [Serinibacter arcticus]PWD50767.1 Fe-S cluster assembly protein HesB [Serinibacter arcticus]
MLTLTENAQTAVNEIAARADLPAGGGLRIAPSATQPGGLDLGLAAEPAPGDQVIETGAVPVFVEPQTSASLDALTLDTAPVTPDQPGPAFQLTPQAAAS